MNIPGKGKYLDLHNLPAWSMYDGFTAAPYTRRRNDFNCLRYVAGSVTDDEASAPQLEELFTAQREAEWGEFLSDCGKYETELASEVEKGKLTLAELDEEEQSLDRLEGYLAGLQNQEKRHGRKR